MVRTNYFDTACLPICTALLTVAALPWASAAGKSTAADDPCFKNFSLYIEPAAGQEQKDLLRKGVSFCNSSDTSVPATLEGLSRGEPQLCECLCLDAKLPWPLGVLITQEHLGSYNRLFRLLLQVKRVQLDLEAAWQELGR
jgi:hypothetical protein